MTTTTSRPRGRFLGPFIAGVGIFHIVLFLVMLRSAAVGIISDGIFDAVGVDGERSTLVYGGIMMGAILMMLGLLATSWTRATNQPLPRYLGWLFLAFGLIGIILQPATGAYFFVIFALIILFTKPQPAAG